jgi:preprotein translocase subunit SecB
MAKSDSKKAKSDSKNGGGEASPDAAKTPEKADGGEAVPKISVRTQYIKDFSFENPAAPQSLSDTAGAPKIQVNVDVEAKPLGQDHYEVALHINAKGTREESTIFVVELVYGGLFALEHFPKDKLQAMCLVECPRILFPFARRVIADATREGGFPPLLLDPIDFGRLYRNNRGGGTAPGKKS